MFQESGEKYYEVSGFRMNIDEIADVIKKEHDDSNSWCKSLQGDGKKYAKKMFGKINQIVADDDKKKEILKFQ